MLIFLHPRVGRDCGKRGRRHRCRTSRAPAAFLRSRSRSRRPPLLPPQRLLVVIAPPIALTIKPALLPLQNQGPAIVVKAKALPLVLLPRHEGHPIRRPRPSAPSRTSRRVARTKPPPLLHRARHRPTRTSRQPHRDQQRPQGSPPRPTKPLHPHQPDLLQRAHPPTLPESPARASPSPPPSLLPPPRPPPNPAHFNLSRLRSALGSDASPA